VDKSRVDGVSAREGAVAYASGSVRVWGGGVPVWGGDQFNWTVFNSYGTFGMRTFESAPGQLIRRLPTQPLSTTRARTEERTRARACARVCAISPQP
jgi:hypothetical protein